MDKNTLQKILNKDFVRARKFIEERLGINLTLIELVELRKTVEYTQNIYLEDCKRFLRGKIGGDKCSIHPDMEAALIFMNKNYGTQINDLIRGIGKFDYYRTKTKMDLGYDYYPEFFKRMQEDMHYP